MKEVLYSLNGYYFKDFGVIVSESKGLGDTLKRKKANTYEWAEYHGVSMDLSKPKFEPREIELDCFIIGDDWQVLFNNFNKLIRDEFSKSGTQRLLVQPMGFKALPYEVVMTDDVNLNKKMKDGQMVATFTMKLTEPNPIKKILYFTGTTLDLSYDCPTQTEIFYGNGLKEVGLSNVELSNKALSKRFVSSYQFDKRNLLVNSGVPIDITTPTTDYLLREIYISGSTIPSTGTYTIFIEIQTFAGYTASIWFLNPLGNDLSYTTNLNEFNVSTTKTVQFTVELTKGNLFEMLLYNYGWQSTNAQRLSNKFKIKKISLVKGENIQNWTPAPEDERFIVIAGNVEDITNLTTNADVLWERL